VIYIKEKFTGPRNNNDIKLSIVTIFILISAFYLFALPTKNTSMILFEELSLLLVLGGIYLLVWKLAKHAGQLEGDSYQIVVKDHEIEAIYTGEPFIILKAEDILDLKVGFIVLKFKPKSYRNIARAYEIIDEYSLKAYERNQPWMGIEVPKISGKDRIRLKQAIEKFKKMNNIK